MVNRPHMQDESEPVYLGANLLVKRVGIIVRDEVSRKRLPLAKMFT